MIFKSNTHCFDRSFGRFISYSAISLNSSIYLWSDCWREDISLSDGWNDYVFEKDLS